MDFSPIQNEDLPPPAMAEGGMLSGGQLSPWFERREASSSSHPGGLLMSSVAGRTDQLPKNVPVGAYVMPADVVSGLGEGNTLAGAKVLDRMFNSNPYGVATPKLAHGRGMGIPAAPHLPKTPLASGGDAQQTPVILAGGEYVINPDAISSKFGDLKKGHRILDNFVLHTRNETRKKLGKLKPPKK